MPAIVAPSARVSNLLRYPLKAFSAEPLTEVVLSPGQTIPFDRAYAIENGPGRFDPDAPRHLPKVTFLTLMRDERIAALRSVFDESTSMLTILRDGKQVARGQLSGRVGRSMIEQFIAAYFTQELRGAPRIVSAPGHSFSDVAAKCLHVVNLASLRELERAAGRTIDPIRFRPNVVVEGWPAWREFDLIGRDFTLGGVRCHGLDRTQRCAATNVEPQSGKRDMAIPAILERTWGHSDFGVYARVETAGKVAVGDLVATEG